MEETSAERPGAGLPTEDPLTLLDDIDSSALADQVAVFDAIHEHLSDRLSSAES
ncbi:hypothetical protein [Georgenia subflava]|uniref:hypothetical protein n=1 Tax=Georgenia subflava TaxID=1622177 RepID=UPI00186B210C|nr:hypothetical protein [Georgenia subflava]